MAEKFVLTAQLNTQLNMASVRATVTQLRTQLQGINIKLNVTGGAQVNKQMQNIANTTDKVNKKVKTGKNLLGDFGHAGALAAKRFAAFSIATAGFIAFVSAIKNGVKEAIAFERQMIRISQVTGMTMNELSGLKDAITGLATGLGVSSEKLVDISRTLAQTGMSARDTQIALEALAKTELAPTFTDIKKTTEAAIAAMRQFNIEAGRLEATLGQMNALAGSFAVEADDLGVVIRRAGGAFKSAGGSLLELESLFTSVRSTTRESAETIATGFRTIFTRMRRPKTIGFLKDLGVNLEDLEGKFVGPYEAVRRLNAALSELDPRDTRYAQIIEELGGFRQVSKVIPLIQQFEQAELARATAIRGSTSLTKDAMSAQDALAIRLMKLREQFAELMRTIMDNKGIQIFIDMALRMAEAILKIVEAIEPLIPLIAVLGASALFKGGGRLLAGARGGLGFAGGGMVPGTGNTDSVPAMLTPGEFVIRKTAAANIGSKRLHAMNQYAAGGVVRKGRYAYGAGKAMINVPPGRLGGLFLRPEQSDTATEYGTSIGIPNETTMLMIMSKTGLTAAEVTKNLSESKGVQVKANIHRAHIESSIADKFEKNVKKRVKRSIEGSAKQLSKQFNIPPLTNNQQKAAKDAVSKVDTDSIGGHVFEGVLSSATGAALSGGGAGWDFKNPPVGNLSKMFGELPAMRAADAKRTDSGTSLNDIKRKTKNIFEAGGKSNVFPDEIITPANIKLTGAWPKPGSARAKKFTRRAKGGVVDSVPSLLTPGEFVVNKSSAQAIGYGNLHSMNKYAAGGIVRKGRSNYGAKMGGIGSSPASSMGLFDQGLANQAKLQRKAAAATNMHNVSLTKEAASEAKSAVMITTGVAAEQRGMMVDEKTILLTNQEAAAEQRSSAAMQQFIQMMAQFVLAMQQAGAAMQQAGGAARMAGGGGGGGMMMIGGGGKPKPSRKGATGAKPPGMKADAGMGAMGMIFAADMILGMATSALEADSALKKLVEVTMQAVTVMMMIQMMGGAAGMGGMFQKAGAMGGKMGLGGIGSKLGMRGAGPWSKGGAVKGLSGKFNVSGGAGGTAGALGKVAGPALIGGMVGHAVGSAIQDSGMSDAARIAAEGGTDEELAGAKATAVAGGVLAGAAMGAATGAMIGTAIPVIGTAVGAVVGGLVGAGMGWVDALNKVEDTIAAARLGRKIEAMNTGFRDVEMGLRPMESMGANVTTAMRGIAIGMAGEEEERKKAKEGLKSSFQPMMKFIDATSKTSSSMEQFFSRVDKSTMHTFAALNGIPYDELEEKIRKQIEASEEARKAAEKQKQAALGIEKLRMNLKHINVAADSATQGLGRFSARAKIAAGGKGGFKDLGTDVIDRPGDLTRAELGGGKVEAQVGALTSILGGQGDKLRDASVEGIKGLGQLKESLISVRTTLDTTTLGETGTVQDVIREELEKDFRGIGDAGVDAIMKGLDTKYAGEAGAKKLQEAIDAGNLDDVIGAASEGIKSELETLKKIAKLINEASKELQNAFNARVKVEKAILDQTKKLRDMQIGSAKKMQKLRTGKGFTPEQGEAEFQKTQRTMLEAADIPVAAGAATIDLDATISTFHELNASIKANKEAMLEGADGTVNEIERRKGLMDANAKMQTQLTSVTSVLKNFQDTAKRGAELEERIQKIKQDEAMRLGGVDSFIGANDEARRQMDEVAGFANRVATGAEAFSDVPQELRGQVFDMMKKFAKVEGPQGTRFKAGVERVRSEVSTAQGLDLSADDLARFAESPTEALTNAIDELGTIYAEAEKVQTEAFIKHLEDQKTDINEEIKNIAIEVTKGIQLAMAEETKAANQEEITQLTQQNTKLAAIHATLVKMEGMGVDVTDEARVGALSKLAEGDQLEKAQEMGFKHRLAQRLVGVEEGDVGLAGAGEGAKYGQENWWTDARLENMMEGDTEGLVGIQELVNRTGNLAIGQQKWVESMKAMETARIVQEDIQRGDFAGDEKSTAAAQKLIVDLQKMAREGADLGEVKKRIDAEKDAGKIGKPYLDTISKGMEELFRKTMLDVGTPGMNMGADDWTGGRMEAAQRLMLENMQGVREGWKTQAEAAEEVVRSQLEFSMPDATQEQRDEMREKLMKGGDFRKDIAGVGATTKKKVETEMDKNTASITSLTKENQTLTGAINTLNTTMGTLPSAAGGGGAGPDTDASKAFAAMTKPGSIFTHDEHLEAALVSTNALLGDILEALKPSGGGGGNASVGGVAGAATGSVNLPTAMAGFTAPANMLSSTLAAFNQAFSGGMKWTLEASHVIKVEGFDGLEIFNSLEGKFSELVRNITMNLINKELEDRLPQLVKKPPTTPMGQGLGDTAGDE